MKLSLKELRFLIVWISINAFALFVNIVKIKGEVQKEQPISSVGKELNIYNTSIPHDSLIVNRKFVKAEIDLFTHANDDSTNSEWMFDAKDPDKRNEKNSFYPFRTKFLYSFSPRYTYFKNAGEARLIYDNSDVVTGFLGIFNGYSYLEFIVYNLFAFAVMFLPKLWRKKN